MTTTEIITTELNATTTEIITTELNATTVEDLSTFSEAVWSSTTLIDTTDVTRTFATAVNITSTIPGDPDASNLGLIIGLSVGIPCGVALIVAVIVAIVCLHRKRNKAPSKPVESTVPSPFYDTAIMNIPRVTSPYDDFGVLSRNEPIYETVLQTFSPEYETALPRR